MLSAPLPVLRPLALRAGPPAMSPKTQIATGKLPFTDRNIQSRLRPSNPKMPDFGPKARFAGRCCRKVTCPSGAVARRAARSPAIGANRLLEWRFPPWPRRPRRSPAAARLTAAGQPGGPAPTRSKYGVAAPIGAIKAPRTYSRRCSRRAGSAGAAHRSECSFRTVALRRASAGRRNVPNTTSSDGLETPNHSFSLM